MKRYEIEYVNDRIRRLKENDLMREEFRSEKIERLNKCRSAREKGLITADEFMHLVSHA